MKVESVMALEYMLFLIEEGKGANKRDAENYFVSIFGTPDAHGTWGFRWEGHHCSQNFTIVDGVLVGSTPSFLASKRYRVFVRFSISQHPKNTLTMLQVRSKYCANHKLRKLCSRGP
jgi:hypothetical protein